MNLETSVNQTEKLVIPAEVYISRDFASLERERFWPKVWQMACRLEEIEKVGSFVTYDICYDSIIVVRTTSDEIKAYYNVCPHRGRRLTEGCGRTGKFHCKFHGWQWNLQGQSTQIVDREDWGSTLDAADTHLREVKLGTWGGWVFINMDPDCEPLQEALEPAKSMLDPFEIQNMRFAWRKWLIMPCNWKVALEAFNEGYHVQTTHPQLLNWIDDVTSSEAFGRHGMFGYPDVLPFGSGSARLGSQRQDTRQALSDYYEEMDRTLKATMTQSILAAARRLPTEAPADATPIENVGTLMKFAQEEDAKRGVTWPTLTPEQFMAAGVDWHIFPNMVFLQQTTNVLGYRARPYGDDPDYCIFETYSLEKFGTDGAPVTENEFVDNHEDEATWGLILIQDYQNMKEVQRGMKVRGFKGARPNPKQERPVYNLHAEMRRFMGLEDAWPYA